MTSLAQLPKPRTVGLLVALLFLLFSGAVFFLAIRKSAHSGQTFIYLMRPDQSALEPQPVQLKRTRPEDQVRELVDTLLTKSHSAARDQRVVPTGTRLLNIRLEGNTATLDFNSSMNDPKFWQGSEHEYLGVYAIVNTVTQVAGVRQVKMLVEGHEIETLGGHVELIEPLERDASISHPRARKTGESE